MLLNILLRLSLLQPLQSFHFLEKLWLYLFLSISLCLLSLSWEYTYMIERQNENFKGSFEYVKYASQIVNILCFCVYVTYILGWSIINYFKERAQMLKKFITLH